MSLAHEGSSGSACKPALCPSRPVSRACPRACASSILGQAPQRRPQPVEGALGSMAPGLLFYAGTVVDTTPHIPLNRAGPGSGPTLLRPSDLRLRDRQLPQPLSHSYCADRSRPRTIAHARESPEDRDAFQLPSSGSRRMLRSVWNPTSNSDDHLQMIIYPVTLKPALRCAEFLCLPFVFCLFEHLASTLLGFVHKNVFS